MDYKEIIKLLEAGYTRDEIMEMDSPADPDDPAAPADSPEPDPTPADEIKAITDTVAAELKEVITGLKNEITAMNIMHSRIEPPAEAEDVIAQIINPTRKENK